MKLSINLNKIALIRNSRGSISPSIEYFARTALEENILGLTAHPRPDNRHIRYEDLVLIRALTDEYQKEFNIEGNPLELTSSEYKGYLAIIEEFKPTQATLVPDDTNQLTSDHGWSIDDLEDEAFTDQIKDNEILLFMKGSPYQPQCGFSSKVAQILFSYDIEFSYIDVLEFPEVRANLPKISEWPTFPQLFVKGELVGGCDIVLEMHESKELESVFNPQ